MTKTNDNSRMNLMLKGFNWAFRDISLHIAEWFFAEIHPKKRPQKGTYALPINFASTLKVL